MNYTSRNNHAIFVIKCFFPEGSIIPLIFAKFLNAFRNCISILFYQIADTNHRIAAITFRHSYQFHLTVNSNIALVVHKITDHVPRVQFMAMKWISVTPNVTRNNVSILQVFFYKFDRM